MNTDKAKQLFEEIVELCYQTENPRLIELIESIYPDVEETKELSRIQSYAEEVQVRLSEIDLVDDEEDIAQDIQDKIELLSE